MAVPFEGFLKLEHLRLSISLSFVLVRMLEEVLMAQNARPYLNIDRSYLHKLNVVELEIAALKPFNRRARRHLRKHIKQIAKSIETFGFVNPVLIDEAIRVIAGHGRVLAATKLGMRYVPTIQLSGLSEAQLRAYVLADNKIAENSEWDPEILAIEFQHLLQLDIGLDLTITGFTTPEIDLIFGAAALEEPEPPVPPVSSILKTSRKADSWALDNHRLFCGDAQNQTSYQALLAGMRANMVFTDPPYNLRISSIMGKGDNQYREFPMASGEMTADTYSDFLQEIVTNCVAYSTDGSLHFVFIDWRKIGTLVTIGSSVYAELKNICVWDKQRGGMGSLYRSQHELIAVFKNGTATHTNNIDLGRHGRNRTNVWRYPPAKPGGEADLNLHPTAKPISMIADAIMDCSHRGDIILDPFGGSGTTLLAAERTGRCGYLIELDPLYVDLIIRRWQQMTGRPAVHIETGKTFDEMTHTRSSETQFLEVCHD
jgi:DNA modification methylase